MARLADVYKQRLLALAYHLDSVPDKLFDISLWRNELDCGTVACAVGHATALPYFRDMGFGYSEYAGCPVYHKRTREELVKFSGWDAVEKFFGLKANDSYFLFMEAHYPNRFDTKPREVSERIKEFVRKAT